MDDSENQFVNVTAYYAEPAKIFSVPSHYSLDEIQEAIRSEMSASTFEPPSRDSSSITIASGELSFSICYSQTIKRPKGLGETNTSIGEIASDGSIDAIIYSLPNLASFSGKVHVLETKNSKVILYFTHKASYELNQVIVNFQSVFRLFFMHEPRGLYLKQSHEINVYLICTYIYLPMSNPKLGEFVLQGSKSHLTKSTA